MTEIEDAQQRLAEYRHDPVKMVVEKFGVTPDAKQAQALRAFGDQSKTRARIALQACVGVGKTSAMAWCAWNLMACYASPDRYPSGIAISESGKNLRDGFWKELAVWQARWPLLGEAFELTTERLFEKTHPQTWFLSARTYPQTADQEAMGRTLSGLHSKFIGYFCDESGDIPPAVLRSAEQGLSDHACAFGRIMQAGNPTSHDGMLYHAAAAEPHKWILIPITGDPDDPERSARIDIEWAREQIAQYGRDNPWVMATILGQFPETAVNALLGIKDVEDAQKRHLKRDEYAYSQKRIGIDPARFGDDSTVLCPRQGLWVGKLKALRNADGTVVTGAVLQGKEKFGSEMELIDSTGGYASSIVDQCRLAGVELYEVNFSGKADDARYYNKRAEMAFRMAEACKHGAAWPPDPQLKREVLALRFWYDHGKFRILEKEQIKKALNGHSPDRADALMTTYAVVDMPASDAPEMVAGQSHKHVSDWDPMRDA